jgi:alpha-aminoadipic semialdehyde synthase
MRHEVTTHQNPNQVHGVDFVYYGHQGEKNTSEYSAMAQTVGYPCAIAAHLVLSGEINSPGMVTPLPKAIYSPILEELKLLGIEAKRTKTFR